MNPTKHSKLALACVTTFLVSGFTAQLTLADECTPLSREVVTFQGKTRNMSSTNLLIGRSHGEMKLKAAEAQLKEFATKDPKNTARLVELKNSNATHTIEIAARCVNTTLDKFSLGSECGEYEYIGYVQLKPKMADYLIAEAKERGMSSCLEGISISSVINPGAKELNERMLTADLIFHVGGSKILRPGTIRLSTAADASITKDTRFASRKGGSASSGAGNADGSASETKGSGAAL